MRSRTPTGSRWSVSGNLRPPVGTSNDRPASVRAVARSAVGVCRSSRVSLRPSRAIPSVLLGQSLRQVADDGVSGAELLLDVRELPARILQEERATGEVEQRKEIEEHQRGETQDRPQVRTEQEVLVGREEAHVAQDDERQQQEHHRGKEGGIRDHLKA